MSIQNIQQSVQNVSEYKITKKKETEIQQTEQIAQEIRQIDEYDKENPVGEEVEGIYSVSHDDEGNLKINYKQPASKNETQNGEDSESETMQVKANEKTDKAAGGAAPAASGSEEASSSDSDDDDDELEELKKQRDAIKQQLNREVSEDVKATLRAQLQAIEVQIALKSSGTSD